MTQTVRHRVPDVDPVMVNFCPVDNLAHFTFTDVDGTEHTGTGLFEIAAIGPHSGYGFTEYLDGFSG